MVCAVHRLCLVFRVVVSCVLCVNWFCVLCVHCVCVVMSSAVLPCEDVCVVCVRMAVCVVCSD